MRQLEVNKVLQTIKTKLCILLRFQIKSNQIKFIKAEGQLWSLTLPKA